MMRYFFLAILCIYSFCVEAVVVGSYSAVSRQSLTTFITAENSTNEMRGFAAFEGGFSLENYLTNCLFTSLFPVSGDLLLHGGTLTLQNHMYIDEHANIASPGTFIGNGYTIEFLQDHETVILPSGLTGGNTIAQLDQKDVNRDVNSVSWSYDNAYLAIGTDKQSGSNGELRVYSFDGSTLTLEDTMDVDDQIWAVAWHPSEHYVLVGIDRGSGKELRIYHFNTGTDSLSLSDEIEINRDIPAVCWNPSGTFFAATTEDNTTEVRVYSFSAGSMALVDTVNISPNRTVRRRALDWSSVGNYLAVGVNNSSHDELLIYHFDGAVLTQTLSEDFNNGKCEAVSWSPTAEFLAVGTTQGSEKLLLYKHTVADGTLTVQTSAYVNESRTPLALDWHPTGEFLAVGRDDGSGSEFKVYSFDASLVTLSLFFADTFGDENRTVAWSPNGSYIARGGDKELVTIYGLSGDDKLIFDNVHLVFNTDVTLQDEVTFKNNCTMYGKGNTLDLGVGNIILDNGASLLCDSITIKNIAGTNIRCLDSVGTVSLQNATLELVDTMTFSKGRIDICDDVRMTGTQMFVYNSDQVSTIQSHATWYFDSGMTFKYDPQIASQALIACADLTSQLHLYETTLQVTTTGLQLTKGTLTIEGICPVVSDATVPAEGISFGNGVQADDFTVSILPDSRLDLQSGYINSKNVGT